MYTEFTPDWVVPPGDTISELLAEKGLSTRELATSLRLSEQRTSALLCGKIRIDQDIASCLNKKLGLSELFWLEREAQYRKSLKRLSLAQKKNWVESLPTNQMIKLGWINKPSNIEEKYLSCIDFFGVSDIFEWNEKFSKLDNSIAYRTSLTFESSNLSTATWVRKGEIEATKIITKPWNKETIISRIQEIRSLTKTKSFHDTISSVRKILSDCGVALVYAPTLKGCHASGATKFISKNKALILLSGRYKTDDQLWFTIFHEIGHLILHDNSRTFVEGTTPLSQSDEEEANEFSFNILIPDEIKSEFFKIQPSTSPIEIRKFSKLAGISTGIVIGQLQKHKTIPYNSKLNRLKNRYKDIEITP